VTRALVWGFAGLGVSVSGLVFAILAVGLIEGWHPMPDALSEVLAVVVVTTATWTAGVLCERAPGRWVAAAVAIVPGAVLIMGFLLLETNEAHRGARLAPTMIAKGVAISAVLVGGAAFVARRGAPALAERSSVSTLTGVAAAYGLSASGIALGALLARWLDTSDILPEGSAPTTWVLLGAVGTAAAGATVADIAGQWWRRSVASAGILAFIGLWEIFQSVEATGVEGAELPVIAAVAVAFAGLLSAGAWCYRRLAPSS
jgi:hypothetical protein